MIHITVYDNKHSREKFKEIAPLVEDLTDFCVVHYKPGSSKRLILVSTQGDINNFKYIKEYLYGARDRIQLST